MVASQYPHEMSEHPFVPPMPPQYQYPTPTLPLKEPKTVHERAIYFIIIQAIMLGLSTLTGRFKWTFFSTLDSAILLISISFTSMLFVDINEKRRNIWFTAAVISFFAGVFMMSISLLFA